jgi:hypothetical protein
MNRHLRTDLSRLTPQCLVLLVLLNLLDTFDSLKGRKDMDQQPFQMNS